VAAAPAAVALVLVSRNEAQTAATQFLVLLRPQAAAAAVQKLYHQTTTEPLAVLAEALHII
jgi:hypothetical protein